MKTKGQSLVEFAVGLVLLLIVLAGLVELATALFQQVQMLDAAQEGTVFGSICPNVALIENRVRTSSESPVDLQDTGRVSVETNFNPSSPAEGGEVSVSVTYQHKVFAPFASIFFGKEIPIKGKSSGTILKTDGCP